ncbi:iron-containing alcohol dehydrogenase [Anaerocolumna xylanovorans]|uniref:Alcohol dehydrogenase, class IV n=1 Tax=Anaerocolumna xylanovorans DSM 12503 TaxID=1121345 RepID=A0A1M7YA15_9FIRM|nr:iron-containing alcohol dehydrogenase [Anaerocolumna xylanovorans]SHO49460.1 Alcohol dehydrogenase, class IV [Anaerocolumna xylanovorans DSM 12503]
MAYQFTLPRNVFIGKNALEASETAIKALGKKAFVVTGRIVTRAGIVGTLTGYLESWGIEYVVFNDITGEPTDVMIEAGVKAYKQTGCDFLIAIGGGSPLDSAKAIAAMTVLPGKISDYMGRDIMGKFPPMVLIPTTAGTGSEATKFTVITDSVKGIKMLLKGNSLLPDLAVIDPTFTLTSPPDITAATGMDALTHAVEAYTSRKSTPLTENYALSAVKRIFKYLPIAYSNGSDEKAREEMQLAAFEAGVGINNASVTLVHGMSRPIGALFHVPHGISNAMLIKECLTFALDGSYERFARLARAIGTAEDTTGDIKAAGAFIEELVKLCKHCNIPTLEEYGINKSAFEAVADKMAEDAMASGSPSNTIKEVTKEDLLKIYERLW